MIIGVSRSRRKYEDCNIDADAVQMPHQRALMHGSFQQGSKILLCHLLGKLDSIPVGLVPSCDACNEPSMKRKISIALTIYKYTLLLLKNCTSLDPLSYHDLLLHLAPSSSSSSTSTISIGIQPFPIMCHL